MKSPCRLKLYYAVLILFLLISTGSKSQHVDSIRASVQSILKARGKSNVQSKISPASAEKSLDEIEKDHILSTLKETGGNYSKAARILGISRVTLYNKIREYGVNVKKMNSG